MKRAAMGAVAAALTIALVPAPGIAAPDLSTPTTKPSAAGLETVQMVHNWVLCVTEAAAETMAEAEDAGPDAADKAYAGLVASKTCGRLPKFGVVLHRQFYPALTPAGVAQKTRAYAASVNIGIGWMDAFVVAADDAQTD